MFLLVGVWLVGLICFFTKVKSHSIGPLATQQHIHRKEVKEVDMFHNLKVVKQELASLGKTRELIKLDLRQMQKFMLEEPLANSRL